MPSPSSTPLQVLGRYALYGEIAAGGMATVHIGRLMGPAGFARTVAIKRLHPQYARDPEFVAMLLDEARLAARVQHPNVVQTLDVVALDGELFLVMEYVHGESLARLLRLARDQGKPIVPQFIAAIIVTVLDGLHAAHEAKNEHGELLGLVHRDVSPQNVLVGTDGIARVLDFGVAKAAGRAQTTREGQLKGKIAYMSPEQIRGNVSRLTDVYASAVVLWEGLTGQRLFSGDGEVEVFGQVLEKVVEPPSRYTPGIPPALDALTLRGLDRDPANRFPTAREMARALEESLPLVPPSKLAAWVEDLAGPSLADRAARVAQIELSSAHKRASLSDVLEAGLGSSDAVVLEADAVKIDAPPQASSDEGSALTQLSSSSITGAGSRPPARPRWVLAGAAGAAVVALVAVLGLRGRGHPASTGASAVGAPTEDAAASAIASAAPATSTIASAAPATSTIASAAPVPASSTAIPAVVTARPVRGHRATVGAPPARPASQAQAPGSTPRLDAPGAPIGRDLGRVLDTRK